MATYQAGSAAAIYDLDIRPFERKIAALRQQVATLDGLRVRPLEASGPSTAAAAAMESYTAAQQRAAAAHDRTALTAARVATEQQRTVKVSNDAATAAQRYATEVNKTDAAQKRAALSAQQLNTETARTAAAQSRAASAALRLEQQQIRASKAGSNGGGLGPALPRTFAGFSGEGQRIVDLTKSIAVQFGVAGTAAAAAAQLVRSFADAFTFKAQLDATNTALRLQVATVRDVQTTYTEAASFADRFKLTQVETNAILQASIGVLRTSKASFTEAAEAAALLQSTAPEKPISEAARAIRELASGDVTSIKELFNIPAADALRMKNAIAEGGDSVQIVRGYLEGLGFTLQGAMAGAQGTSGALRDAARAAEELQIAQGEFAAGPGLALLQVQIAATRTGTQLLSGDFIGLGQGLQQLGQGGITALDALSARMGVFGINIGIVTNALRGGGDAINRWGEGLARARAEAESFTTAINDVRGNTAIAVADQEKIIAAAERAAKVVPGSAQAIDQLIAAWLNGSAPASELVAQLNAMVDGFARSTAAATNEAAAQAQRRGEIMGGADATNTATNATNANSEATLRALQASVGLSEATSHAAAAQQQLASLGAAVVAGLQSAEAAAARLAAQYGITTEEALRLIRAQVALANARALADQRVGERSGGQLNSVAQITAVYDRARAAAQAQARIDAGNYAVKGGGGRAATAATDRTNAQIAQAEAAAQQKMLDAQRTYEERRLQIVNDYGKKRADAERKFNEDMADSRGDLADLFVRMEDQGVARKYDALYQAELLKVEEIARTKGADVANAYLKAYEDVLKKRAQREAEINEALAKGDAARAEALQGVDAIKRRGEDARLADAASGRDSLAEQQAGAEAEAAQQLADAQNQIGEKADAAAERAIAASQRRADALNKERLITNQLATDQAKLAGAALPTPVPGEARTIPPPLPSTGASGDGVVQITAPDLLAAIQNLQNLIERSVGAQEATTGAVVGVERATREGSARIVGAMGNRGVN